MNIVYIIGTTNSRLF